MNLTYIFPMGYNGGIDPYNFLRTVGTEREKDLLEITFIASHNGKQYSNKPAIPVSQAGNPVKAKAVPFLMDGFVDEVFISCLQALPAAVGYRCSIHRGAFSTYHCHFSKL